ncbi:hypothetical protein AHAS_Ahas13G0282100 [Arachis hypogaea]
MRLVSIVVEGYIEEGVHRYIVVVVDNYKEIHHNYYLSMHHGMALTHSTLEEVVAKRVDHKHIVPPLIVPSLMHTPIVISISYNIVRTKLIAKWVRIHSKKRK